jgi:DNA-binding transcriptional regulator YdaS (Cro superfamily)
VEKTERCTNKKIEMAAAKKQVIIIEKTSDGFSGYARDLPIYTTGATIAELINNAAEACSLYYGNDDFDTTRIVFEIDFKQFFKYYRVINAKALAEKIGMNPSLISQYVSGTKKPSEKQSRKILYGINLIGQELADIKVIYERGTPKTVKR